ncbi:MAG: hypothetical protein VX990_06745 [Pseudomonadota bacterium]|nr:hypothetical protein [Pseudomonadota bacterium]
MSSVTPPPPPLPNPPALVAHLVLTVSSPPSEVSDLAIGSRLDATIVSLDAAGKLELQTALGRLVVAHTALPLPSDAAIELQLISRGFLTQFLIAAINGRPPQTAFRLPSLFDNALSVITPAERVATGGSAATPAASSAVSLSVGTVVMATLLQPRGASSVTSATTSQAGATGRGQGIATGTSQATLGGSLSTTPQPLIRTAAVLAPPSLPTTLLQPQGAPSAASGATPLAGATGRGQGIATGVPQATADGLPSTTPQPSTRTGAASVPTSSPAPATTAVRQGTGTGPRTSAASNTSFLGAASSAAPPGAGGPPLPAGSQFAARITTLQPPESGRQINPPAASGALTLAAGTNLSGAVTGYSATGHAIVQTHVGPIAVATPTPVPIGSAIGLEIVAEPAVPDQTSSALPRNLTQAILQTGSWPAFDETLRALQETSQGAAQQLVNVALARPDTALAANILMFLGALRGGELRAWIGDAPHRVLQRAKPDLLGRIREDFSQLSRVANEPATGDWRAVPMPFLNGSEIEQIRLFLQRKGGEEDEENMGGSRAVRFVIELDLSRLGRLQLDGLILKRDKRFDLIVRSEDRFPARVQNDIRGIFEDAAELTGIKGGLTFQAAPPNFIEVAAATPTGDGAGLIV